MTKKEAKKKCAKCGRNRLVENFPTDNSSKDKFWRFCRYCEYLRKHQENPMTEKQWLESKIKKPKTKKVKKSKSKVTKDLQKIVKKNGKVETIKDLKARIEKLSPSNSGIHIDNVTPEIKKWAMDEGYFWEDQNTLYIGKKAV